MKRIVLFLFLLVLIAGTPLWGQAKWPINYTNVSNPTLLERLLTNRFGLVETDVTSVLSVQNKGTGNYWYVDSGAGSSSYDGKDWVHAKATLDQAVALCTANNGDVIFVAQGHAETLAGADGVDIDVAGVTVIGLGSGPDRPKFTLDTTSDEFVIGAGGDGTVIYNLQFLPGVSEVVHCVTIEDGAENVSILSCEFLESVTAAYEFDKAITVEVDANDLTIANCIFTSADEAGATDAIEIGDGLAVRLKIIGCRFHGEYATAPIFSDQVNTDCTIADNVVTNLTTGQFGIEITDASTGMCYNNIIYTDGPTTALDPGSLKCYGNLYVSTIDASAQPIPAADDTVYNLVGVNDSDNAATTSSVVANADGSILERQEYMQKIQEIQLATGLHVIQGTGMALAVWYVNGGVTSGDGKSPSTAFGTVEEAITAADNAVDDWILVMDYSGGGSTISLDDAFCHIIGMSNGPTMPYPRFKPATAIPAFEFKNASDRVELANLVIGGGSQAAAAISADTDAAAGAYGCYIHNCVIGRDSTAPANDGINIANGADMPYLVVENCTFYGVAMGGCDQSGIEIAGNCTGGKIINCYFQDIGTSTDPAIQLSGAVGNMLIQGNRIFGTNDGSAGWAITLGASTTNICVLENVCAASDTDSDTEGYLDSAADEANAWAKNYDGDAIVTPAD